MAAGGGTGRGPLNDEPDDGLAAAAELVRRGRRFLVAAHARLDGDAIGAMLTSAHGLRALGKEVVLYNPDPVPRRFQFLPGAGEIRRRLPSGLRCDAALVHDCGARHLLGEHFPGKEVTGPLIVLDHHEVVGDLGDLIVRDARAASAGVIAWRLLAALGLDEGAMPSALATALFVSLVEDTGWFRYPGTDAEALRLAASCTRAGVSSWDIALELDESHSEASLRLLCQVLPSLERHCEGQLALLTLTDQMLRLAEATPDDVGKLVNYARALRGVEIGALVTVSDERIYVSLRGKGRVHVGEIAHRFGGGGHRNAAGCTIPFAASAGSVSAAPPKEDSGSVRDAATESSFAPSNERRSDLAKQQLISAVRSALTESLGGTPSASQRDRNS